MKPTLAALLALLVALAGTGPRAARAQDPPAATPAPSPPTPAPEAEARAHYERGKELQAARSYADAIVEYERGHALVPAPGFLFNIAQCYRLMGDKTRAVAYYRRFLDVAPRHTGAPAARGHIVTLTRELEAEKPAPTPARPPTVPAAILVPASTPEPADADATPGFGPWQWTGLALASGGLAATGAGIYFGLKGRQLTQDIKTLVPMGWSKELDEKYAEGERTNRLMLGAFIGAGLLLGGGAAAYLYGPREEQPKKPALRVTPTASTSGTFGILVDGRF